MTADITSEAQVATDVPRRYLGQLYKHFQHRLPVELSETRGRIEFPTGVCTLDAEAAPGILLMRAVAADATALTGLEGVVGRHRERFAFREPLTVHWVRQ